MKHDDLSLHLCLHLAFLARSDKRRTTPARIKSSIQHHVADHVHHITRDAISVCIIRGWDDKPSPQNSVENGKGCFEVVALGDDIVHPIWNINVDLANLGSSVKQQLSAFMLIVADGISKSTTSIIIHEVKLSAGYEEDLSLRGKRLRN
jgi:hypothetical protein